MEDKGKVIIFAIVIVLALVRELKKRVDKKRIEQSGANTMEKQDIPVKLESFNPNKPAFDDPYNFGDGDYNNSVTRQSISTFADDTRSVTEQWADGRRSYRRNSNIKAATESGGESPYNDATIDKLSCNNDKLKGSVVQAKNALSNDETACGSTFTDFDLKQAIISSEILKPRF